MTEKQLVKIVIKVYDFTKKEQFDNVINALTVQMFHTLDVEAENRLQSAIWYISDKRDYFMKRMAK